MIKRLGQLTKRATAAALAGQLTTVSAVVIRKDGTREDLGVCAATHSNPLRRLGLRVSQLVNGTARGRITEHRK